MGSLTEIFSVSLLFCILYFKISIGYYYLFFVIQSDYCYFGGADGDYDFASVQFGGARCASARMWKASQSASSALQAPAHLALEAFLKRTAAVKQLGSTTPQSLKHPLVLVDIPWMMWVAN